MLSSSVSATLHGIDGQRVNVEVHISSGLPSFQVVGMPDTSCREARDRVRAAIVSSGFKWPNGARITVNLAPSEVRKEGSGLDLAIAMGIIAATPREQAEEAPERTAIEPGDLAGFAFVGELGLDGTLRAVPGTLSRVAALVDHTVVVAPGAAHEATLGGARGVRACRCLREVADCIVGIEPWPDLPDAPVPSRAKALPDLGEVAGQPFARQALEIAAAGGHNLLLVGPPGAGKSMLARRLPGILPDLDPEVSLVVTRVHSVAGLRLPGAGLITVAPFRAPHHSLSTPALIGGGSLRLRPGEISCAHGGVLFLDELGEFSRQCARCDAPAARGRLGSHQSSARFGRVPGQVLPRRCYESVPMRPARLGRTVSVQRSGSPALHAATVRSFARSHRSASTRTAAERSPAARVGGGGVERRGARAGRGRASSGPQPRDRIELGDSVAASRGTGAADRSGAGHVAWRPR